MRTYGVHCRESAGTQPLVLKVVPVTGAAFSGIIMDHFICASLFPHPLLVGGGHVPSFNSSLFLDMPILILQIQSYKYLRSLASTVQ